MAWVGQAVGGVLGTVGTIISNQQADQTRRDLLTEEGLDPLYSKDTPNGGQPAALAQMLLNARMPGAATEEQNIYGTQAAQNANIDRAATDSSQALALKSMNAANTDKAFSNLGTQESQHYDSALGNYNQQENQFNQYTHEDAVRNWQDHVNLQLARGNIKQQEGQNLVNLGGMFSGSNFGGGGGKG